MQKFSKNILQDKIQFEHNYITLDKIVQGQNYFAFLLSKTYTMLQNSLGHSLAHLKNFKLFIFRLKPDAPLQCCCLIRRVWYHIIALTTLIPGRGAMTPIMLKKVQK